MTTWRRLGYAGILMGGFGQAILLPGCGGGGGAGNTAGPNAEVEIVPPVDAQGKPYSIEDESKPASKAKAR